jgi:beta-phosphoglucomutase-like phosphatase (HAD superfamily)
MQLAIFDIDGTLTQTTHIDAVCFLRAFQEVFGVAIANANWAGYTHSTDSGISLELFEKHFGRPPSTEEIARFEQRFVALLDQACTNTAECARETPGARAALLKLPAHDWAVAIATGSWRQSALLKLRTAGIRVDDLPAAFADDSPVRDEIVDLAAARASDMHAVHFTRVVYFGDAIWDVRAATRLRLPFIGVAADGRPERLRAAGATEVIGAFSDFDQLLRSLDSAQVPGQEATS